MPFPIGVVGVIAVGIVGVVGGGALAHDDHSDYYDHSDYSDAIPRKIRETESQIRNARNKISGAEDDLDDALEQVKNSLIAEIEAAHLDSSLIRDWDPRAEDLDYKSFERGYSKLDEDVREKIRILVGKALDQQIQIRQQELGNINSLIRMVNETRLTGK